LDSPSKDRLTHKSLRPGKDRELFVAGNLWTLLDGHSCGNLMCAALAVCSVSVSIYHVKLSIYESP